AGNSLSLWQNLLLFYLFDCFVLIYFHGLLFIQLHNVGSEILASLQEKSNWAVNYRNLKLRVNNDRLSVVQNSVLVTMMFNLLLVFGYATHKGDFNLFYLVPMFASALFCILSLQLQFQNFFKDSLKGMFDLFNEGLK